MTAIPPFCATSADQREGEDGASQTPQFSQIKAAPESFKDRPSSLGGQVLGPRMKDGTCLEVLQLPLNDAQQPGLWT